jgi:small subunit ribosomal protein S6
MVRSYELMWILAGSASEADGATSIERLRSLVSSRGGQVLSAEFWARRTLAYSIKGNKEGAYFVARLSLDGSQVPEFERALLTEQTILRHMLVRVSEVQAQPESAPEPRPESGEPVGAGAEAGRQA